MTDVMIDLETLGTSPQTVVLSIGACFFCPEKKLIGPKFYRKLDIQEQLRYNRKIDADTLKWWMNQSDAAKKVFSENAKPVSEVLTSFVDWFLGNNEAKQKGTFIWGNGSTFDVVIIEDLLKMYGIEIPWQFYNIMDLRTFKRFCANNEKLEKSGVNHNALDDATSQSAYVIKHLKK